MAGYNGFSMSNNAVSAYKNGLCPASKIKGVPSALVRKFCRPEEWHHSSKAYNKTDFYDPAKVRVVFGLPISEEDKKRLIEVDGYEDEDFLPNGVAVEALEKDAQQETKIYNNCRVEWLEWSGSFKHPNCVKMIEDGCTVSVKGQTATITLKSGGSFTKRLTTNGFHFRTISEKSAIAQKQREASCPM